MDRFVAMHSFVRVASLRSFGRAAAELGVSPATVTAHVQHLERALGVRLLERTTRALRLTEEGGLYFEHCCRTLEDMRQVEGLLASRGPALRGVLRADVPVVLGRRLIAPHLGTFLGRHPHLALHLSMENRSQDLIGRGWDCAIRIAALPDSSLIARRLGAVRWITCAAPDYLARAGEPASLADLARHNCLGFMPIGERAPAPWRFECDGRMMEFAPSGNLVMDSLDPLLDAAAAGVGVVQVDHAAARAFLADGRLRRVLAGFAAGGPPIMLIAAGTRQMSRKVRAFGDFVESLLA
jgi:LysR family transcriptional regulator for bpeEF and oprC